MEDVPSQVMLALREGYQLPSQGGGDSTHRVVPRRRLAQEDCDALTFNALLAVKAFRKVNTDVGFLLRHYWVPATELTFHQSSVVTVNGVATEVESVIRRTLAKCRADMVIWRDRIESNAYRGADSLPNSRSGGPQHEDVLKCYNRSEQSLRWRPSLSRDPMQPLDLGHAKTEAMARLSFLHPIGPVPMGDAWEQRTSSALMRYRLESEHTIGDTRVALIRRSGEASVPSLASVPATSSGEIKVTRSGITVFAYDRAIALEDRLTETCRYATNDGTECRVHTLVVTRLIRSVPVPTRNVDLTGRE